MRRTLVLALLVLVGAALVRTVRPPARPTREETLRGPRVFRVVPSAVRAVEVTLGERGFVARRSDAGWTIDGRTALRPAAEALDDLVALLVGLRAVDVFRPRDAASYGLDPPAGTIRVTSGRRTTTIALGSLNAAGSAIYARRAGDPRVMQVGTLLLSSVERVFFRLSKRRVLGARDREVGLGDAASAAAETAQLLDQEERLVAVGPAHEDTLLAEGLDPHRALGLRGERRVRSERPAALTGARPSKTAIRENAVVAVGPLDAEGVAADLLQARDAGRFRCKGGHAACL